MSSSIKKNCSCSLRDQRYFDGGWDFYDFQDYSNKTKMFQKISVGRTADKEGRQEEHYQCTKCGKVYCIMAPRHPYCECHNLRGKKSFDGWWDFYDFQKEIDVSKHFQCIPVGKAWCNIKVEEKWYQCVKCRKVYRLITPEPPFEGTWELVED